MKYDLVNPLLVWYRSNARQLPWREINDPYSVWISEIMLQQTQVKTVIPYYVRWMDRFPTVQALANSSEEDILKAWEGLGYYSRARNIYKTAKIIITEFNGVFPNNCQDLERLPGIGKYTSRAIASIAFGKDEATLDGNIRRVFTRVFNIDEPIRSTACEKELWEIAKDNLPHGKAGDYNQALMELGALLCIPPKPKCDICPLANLCLANQLSLQQERPVKKVRKEIPHFDVVAAVILNLDGQVLLSKRPPQGLLGGMWEFPGGKIEIGEDPRSALSRELHEELGVIANVGDYIGTFKHAYTHFRVTLRAYYCRIEQNDPQPLEASAIKWAHVLQLDDFPMGKLDRLISYAIME